MRDLEERRREAGAWLAEQARLDRAPAVRNTPRGNVVHDVTIEGQRFSACVFGNSILMGARGGWSCPLGGASINNDMADDHGWSVCERWNLPHHALRLSDGGRRALALEFGLPIVPEIGYRRMRELRERDFFYLSPLFQSLIAWARAHPRMISKLYGDAYLGHWPLNAIKGHQVEASPKRLALVNQTSFLCPTAATSKR